MLAHEAVAWMLTYLLHSTLLLGLAWLASKPLSRWSVAAEESVWKLALVGAIVTASLQLAIGWEPAAGRWRLAETAARPAAAETAAIPAVDLAAPATSASLSTREAETTALPAAANSAPKLSLSRLSKVGLEAWLFGTIALLAMHGASYLRLRRRLRPRPRVVGGTLHSQLRGLTSQAGLGKEVRLTCSSRIPVPVAFRSEICVPPRALAGLTDEQQEGMLAHELAHLVRRDSLWLVVSQVVSCILFFQPLNWVARRRLREISEVLSDEWAVSRTGRPLSLAGCLAEVAGWSTSRSTLRQLPVPGMADRPSSLGRRIRRLLDETRSPEHPARRWWLAGAMVVLVVAVAAAAPAVSTGRSEKEPASPQQAAKAQAPEPPKAKEHWVIEGEEHDVAEVAPERDRQSEPSEETEESDSDPDDSYDFGFDFDTDEIADQVNESVAAALAAADGQLAALSEEHTLSQEERERLEQEIERTNEKIQREIAPRMEQLSRELSEKMAHLQEQSAEMLKLREEMAALAERMRPSPEEMARLHSQIDEQVSKLRADGELSRQEREEIARSAREMAQRMRPSEEQRQQMRQLAEEMRKLQRELSERFRTEHIEEIEKAQREMREEIRREMDAAQTELHRTRERQRLLMEEQRRERREEIRKERRREEPKEAPKAKEKPQEAKPPAGA